MFPWVFARARVQGDGTSATRRRPRAAARVAPEARSADRRSASPGAATTASAHGWSAPISTCSAPVARRAGFGRARDRPRGRGGIVSGRPRPSTGRGRSVFGSVTTFRGIGRRKGSRGSRRGDSERARTHEQAKQDHLAGVGVVERETPRHGCRRCAAAKRLRRPDQSKAKGYFAFSIEKATMKKVQKSDFLIRARTLDHKIKSLASAD